MIQRGTFDMFYNGFEVIMRLQSITGQYKLLNLEKFSKTDSVVSNNSPKINNSYRWFCVLHPPFPPYPWGSYQDQITQARQDLLKQAGPCSDRRGLAQASGALLRQARLCSVPESNRSI